MSTKINITETVLRDGQQSLMATRLSTEDILPIVEEMDNAGYYSLECWGGATFDSCLRFLEEDPWDRLREIKKVAKKTKLQMLLRGQNLLGYKHYSDDIVSKFIKKSIENGIDIVRVFDALNDVDNLKTSIKAIKDAGGHAQAAIAYTHSPIHTVEYFVDIAKKYEDLGADSICVKDMSGLLLQSETKELIGALKNALSIDVILHTHCTSGMAQLNYLEAVKAGASGIDTAISPFSNGTSQPPTETMAIALKDQGFETGLDLDSLNKIADYFEEKRNKYIQSGIFDFKMLNTDVRALVYEVPGGMLSNLYSQLKQQKLEHKYVEVLSEVPKIRKDLGYPPLVTPMSQMVGTQAVFNVIMGERYKMVPTEVKDYVNGKYGNPPVKIDPQISEMVLKGEISEELPKKSFEDYRREIGGLAETEEDVLSYALFPEVAKKYLENKWSLKNKIESSIYDKENMNHPV